METKPRRRIVDQGVITAAKVSVNLDDVSADSVLKDALSTVAIEVARYRTKVMKGQALDPKEARIMQGWIKSMTDVMREFREQERANDLSKLSDEEMLVLAKKVLLEGSNIIETETGAGEEDSED